MGHAWTVVLGDPGSIVFTLLELAEWGIVRSAWVCLSYLSDGSKLELSGFQVSHL